MKRNSDYVSFIITDQTAIREFISKVSDTMYEYINANEDSSFVLFYKYLTHSDLPTFGKATRPNSLSQNMMY